MPTTKDCVFSELSLRSGSIAVEDLDHAKTIQEEMLRAGIQRSLSSILAERKLATRETITAISEEALKAWIRCKSCKKQTPFSMVDLSGAVRCKHCQTVLEYSYERISEEDLAQASRGEARQPSARESHKATHGGGGRSHAIPLRAPEPVAAQQTPVQAPEPVAAASEPREAVPDAPARLELSTRQFEELAEEEAASRQDITKFQLRDLLGVSPFGRLYLVQEGARAAVVKVFDRTIAADRVRVKRWVDHMQKVQDLPRAVTTKPVQLFREGSTTYAMRPFVGKRSASLGAWIAARHSTLATPDGVRDAVAAILRSLAEFHAAQVIHGNLRPENIIPGEASACLLDSGLQILLEGLSPEDRALRIAERARHIAPEVARGGESTFASDLFSVGRILEDLLQAHAPKLEKKSPESDAWKSLRDLAAALTAQEPTDRPASASVALQILSPGDKPAAVPTGKLREISDKLSRWSPRKAGVHLAGHAALALVVGSLVIEGIGWQRKKTAFADPARVDIVGAEIAETDLESLTRWSESPGATRAEAEKRWHERELVHRGTALEARVKERKEKALQRLNTSVTGGASALAKARTHAVQKNWLRAAEDILAAGADADASEDARALRTRVLEGLFRDEGMVLIPPSHEGDGGEGRAFLVDARPACRDEDSPGAELRAVTGVDFSEAHLLAASQGKRLPMAEEWDRMAALSAGKGPGWAISYAQRITFVGGLFEWVAESSEDDLSRQGYGTCRGGNRKGVPNTHPLRRKKTSGHGDVGVRFVKDLATDPL